MTRFHARTAFELLDRGLVVLAGSVVEGEVRAGMFFHIVLNSQVSITSPIDLIERPGGDDSKEIWLCVNADSEEAEFLLALDLDDETFEVTETQGA